MSTLAYDCINNLSFNSILVLTLESSSFHSIHSNGVSTIINDSIIFEVRKSKRLSPKICIRIHTVAKKYNKNLPTMAASASHLADWCPDKDNPTLQQPGKFDEKYVQIKFDINRPTTTQEIEKTHYTQEMKNKNANKNNHHITSNFHNLHTIHQLYPPSTTTPTLSSTSHAPSTKHTTKSVPYIADDKIRTIYLEYVKERTEKDRLHQFKMAEIREQYEKEEKENDRLHQLKMAEYERKRKEREKASEQKWEQFM